MIQVRVWIVASGAGKMLVIGIVPTAQGNAIGLESYIINPSKIGHHSYGIGTAMAGSAELLRESIWIEYPRVKDVASAHAA